MLDMELDSFKPRQPLSAAELLHPALEYLPPALQHEIYKTFYIGFSTIFDAIAQVLKARGGIPTPLAVIQAAMDIEPSAVQFYLRKGGKVEYVLDATVNNAREESCLGDGTFEDTFDHEGGEGGELGYRKLAKCANDLEFGAVRLGVGIGEGVVWGPYIDRDEEEEDMDVDEYDGSDSN